jgi:hypothetical protein
MIGIHPCHRRLAELHIKANKLGSYDCLSHTEKTDIIHCLQVNAKLIREIGWLNDLTFVAHQVGDMEYQQELCVELEKLHAKFL